jgi:hypothetical protein
VRNDDNAMFIFSVFDAARDLRYNARERTVDDEGIYAPNHDSL